MKNYIKGLFVNYLPGIIDFIEANKIKNIDFCLNNNFIVKNVINLFDTFLPEFDFTDIKIGRRNDDYVPRIEIVKNQTLSIFIFCTAWTMNLLTNFLIKTKIEKVIGDLFKADDLKGPIFDYYLDENYSFCLWSQLLKDPQYEPPTYKKNTVYYYDHNFIFTIENFPYFYILNRLILANKPLFIFGKQCSGLSFLVNKCLDVLDNNNNNKDVKIINIKMTYGMSTNFIENKINKDMDLILRRVYGEKYQRYTVVYIDDVNCCQKKNIFNEYIRYLLNEKLTYDNKYNQIKYYKDFNIINSGNYYNNLLQNNKCKNDSCYDDNNEKEDFTRYLNQFTLITLNISESNYTSIYKPTLEFHFRIYVPNISNIISNQYLAVLFKMNELLIKEIKITYSNIHYYINIRDITKIVQKFNNFIFRGTNEYTEYLKKIFLYETYSLYSNKFHLTSDIDIFKKILVQSYNSSFKQDKIDIDIFNSIDKDESFMFCKNFIDVYNENPEEKYIPPKDMEYVFIENKADIKNYVIKKLKNFYSDYYSNGGVKNSEDQYYIIHEYNDNMINTIIKMVRLLDNEYPNIILIGDNYSGKELMMKCALFIMKYNYIDINIHKLLTKSKDFFEEETIIKTLAEVVFNDKKIFILFQNDIFDKIDEDMKIYIFELISALIDPDVAIERFRNFMELINDKDNYYNDDNLSMEQIKSRIKGNLQIIISIEHFNDIYRNLFLNYPNIVNQSNILFVDGINDSSLRYISDYIFSHVDTDKEEKVNKKNILLDIHNFAKVLYKEFSKKINIDIPINQRNFLNMCEFFTKNYKKYKSILSKKKENYEKILNAMEQVGKVIEEKQKLIEEISPNKESSEKLIEESRKLITNKNNEKNKVKGKRSDEDKIIKDCIKQKEARNNQLEEIYKPAKDLMKKIGTNISKFTDKDLVECKNTWETFQFGKFLLQKIFIFLGDDNGEDYDYVKKNISPRQLKKFVSIDYTKNRPEYHNFVKEIMDNPEFSFIEKYNNKNFRLALLICDFISAINKFFILYEENIEIRNEIVALDKKIEEGTKTINKYIEEFKSIDNEIDEIQRKIENYELNRNNVCVQIDKYKGLINSYNTFTTLTNENKKMWIEKKEKTENLLKYFNYYLIYISAFINYAPILNRNYRTKFTNYLMNLMNESIEQTKNKSETSKNAKSESEDSKMDMLPIQYLNFFDLMLNFLDIAGADKEIYT